jgi:hypothetical protein
MRDVERRRSPALSPPKKPARNPFFMTLHIPSTEVLFHLSWQARAWGRQTY